jgi:hypothetical protein
MEDKIHEILGILNLNISPNKLRDRFSSRVASDDSLPSSSKEEDSNRVFSQLTMDRQITVRPRINLSRREASLFLSVLNFQVVNFGMSLSMYLTIEYLMSYLLGDKLDPIEIKDEKERLSVMLSFILLLDYYGEFIPLDGYLVLSEDLKQTILKNNLVISKRVAGGRLSHYRPERFFEVRAEVLESKFERSKNNSKRYSSYTKGYGESHPSTHRSKTRPSAELDGKEDTELKFNLNDISKYLILEQLRLSLKIKKQEQKA